jgi:type II secretory pathway pseudopilin PulG
MELIVKLSIICLSASVALTSLTGFTSFSAAAIDLGSITKSSSEQLKSAAKDVSAPLQTNAMIGYAAKQLNLSEETVSASLGSLLKVAQDNLSPENFSLISKAVPDAQSYVDKAPKVSKSSMSSLFSSAGEAGKKAESLDYLKSAFDKLGVSSDQVPGLINSFSSYLDKSGYEGAASALKKGLSFL